MNITNFEKAFDSRMGSCRTNCACGKVFFNSAGSWDWEEEELEKLIDDPESTDLDYSVGYVEFEGTAYVMACNCWNKRAEQIMGFIDDHAHEIADYLRLEKDRKASEASNMATV